jgi:hypothetical protein
VATTYLRSFRVLKVLGHTRHIKEFVSEGPCASDKMAPEDECEEMLEGEEANIDGVRASFDIDSMQGVIEAPIPKPWNGKVVPKAASGSAIEGGQVPSFENKSSETPETPETPKENLKFTKRTGPSSVTAN